MSTFTEAIETAEQKEFAQDEVLDWLESVYTFCIPENKEAGEHAFNVLDYYYMEELGAHIKRQYSELATLRAQLAEANGIIQRLCLSIAYNKTSSKALIESQTAANEYLDSVKSA